MDADRWRRVKELCNEAAARDAAERAAFLADACGADMALVREVDHVSHFWLSCALTGSSPWSTAS